jgi:hypothetical protein
VTAVASRLAGLLAQAISRRVRSSERTLGAARCGSMEEAPYADTIPDYMGVQELC